MTQDMTRLRNLLADEYQHVTFEKAIKLHFGLIAKARKGMKHCPRHGRDRQRAATVIRAARDGWNQAFGIGDSWRFWLYPSPDRT